MNMNIRNDGTKQSRMKFDGISLFERGPAGTCLVFLDFGDLSGDAVHVSSTLRGQLTTAVGVLLHQRHLLQRLSEKHRFMPIAKN